MVATKGTLNSGPSQVVEDHRTCKSVGVGSFKIYSENEKGRDSVDADTIRNARGTLITSRMKSVAVNRGATQTNASVSKATLKNLEKSKGKRNSSVKTNIGRKALADVSNDQCQMSRNEVHDCFKPVKGKSERSMSLQRVAVCPGTRSVNASSRKHFMGHVREKLGQGVGDYHSSKRGIKDLKVSSKDQRTKAQGRKSINTDSGVTARKPPIPTRKSLPVLKRVNQLDTSDVKGNAEISEKGKGKYGFPVKTNISRKVVPQVSSARSYLWRNRVSDGFITMASRYQTNVDSHALSRKSVKTIVKTTLTASNAPRTSKFKCTGLNKSVSAAAISSKTKGKVTNSSIPENTALVIPHEPTQGELQSDGPNNLSTNTMDMIARRKSDRRRSYTSLLMAGSKLLKEHGEVMMQEKLPSIDDNCNHLEVSEYVDEIYQYYWVTEVQNPSLENYMTIQTDITPQMRAILINWLIEVHFKFDLMQETLYLMVSLLDRFLSLVTINKNEMQLVGLTALLLASKYEDFWHPRVKDLISISAESYIRDQMLGMEKAILTKLKFRLNVPTPYVFMLRFLKAAQSDTKLEHLAFYLIELCLVECEALKFKPSLLCASAIYVARCTLQMNPAWTPLLGKHARYEEYQIRDCAEMILKFHKAARTTLLNVTYEKYLRPDHGGVAAIKPLDQLPH